MKKVVRDGIASKAVLERKISAKRVSRAKSSATAEASKLEKAHAELADVNAKLAGLNGSELFSAEKARLEMQKRGLEAKIETLTVSFNRSQSMYFGYLEKNVKLSSN